MNLRDVKRHVLADFDAGNAVILKSQPGFGKTDFTYGLKAEIEKRNPNKSVGMCRAFMATQESVDATGLPWKSEKDYGDGRIYTITDPAVPRWFISTEGKPATMYDIVLMVLEEWGQGNVDTKKAFAPILLEGGVPGFYLPDGSCRIALTNIDQRDGVTKELDFVIGRRGEYTIDGDVRVWIDDFASKPYMMGGKVWNTMPTTIAWAEQNPNVMFEAKPKVQGPWCNPRTICMADRYVQAMADAKGNAPIEDNGFIEGLAGKIGMPATQSYLNFLRFRLELPTYEEVIADPENVPVPKKADLQLLMAYELAGHAKVEHATECMKYVQRLPKDMAITYVTSLLRRDYKGVIQHPAMQGWINKNASLLAVLQSLS